MSEIKITRNVRAIQKESHSKRFSVISTIAIVLAMCLCLTGCGTSKEVVAAQDAINAIGTVTVESGELIATAEELFAALTEDDAAKVENADILAEARSTYDVLVRAAEIESMISAAVSNVTIDSSAAIEAAADAYNQAPAKVQAKVLNYNAIEPARQQVQALGIENIITAAVADVTIDSGDAIAAAVEAYQAAPAEIQAKVTNYEALESARQQVIALKAGQVIDLIDAIGTVSLESGSAIDEAANAYKNLSGEEKAAVTNFDKLTAAQQDLKAAKQAEATKLLSKMKCQNDPFQGCSFYYPKSWKFYGDYWAADVSCFVRPYLGQDNRGNSWMRLVYNYTGDDWVFFKKVIIIADGTKYTKNFNYFDIVHDNGGGDVWEYIDVDVTDSDIEMLTAMANASQTIIRFQGDNYSWDWTMPQSEKNGINEALAAYEMMR